MENKKEHKIAGFIKRYAPGLAAGVVILLLVIYFVNIMVVQNKETAVSVLVLEFMEDTSILEEQVREVLGAGEDQKIEIRSIAAGVEANKAVALTWIRAEVVDVIIGEEEQMTEYAQAGYLKDLSEIADSENEEICFGKCAMEIPGIEMQHPVIGLADNVSNTENAIKLLCYFQGRNNR